MFLETDSLSMLLPALQKLEMGFRDCPHFQPAQPADRDQVDKVLQEVAARMQDNFPYPHPLYAGQMMKPPHAMARLAYMLSLWINPNNHALDGGKASSAMEKEAVAQIAAMFGWHSHLGHLTSGGTMANLEALWIASRLHEGGTIAASAHAHYTHNRLTEVLKIPFRTVAADRSGRMDTSALAELLEREQVACVVATLGTTALGTVDRLAPILALREKYKFRLHIDAAYGGYFKLAANLDPEAKESFELIHEADSIVVDPHKHGLQPYGCGCVLFKEPSDGRFYKHDSPYTYFSSDDLHLGEISLECSRPGSAAVALWATQRLLPLVNGGEFAHSLEMSREAALALFGKLQSDRRFVVPLAPQLDIVVYAMRSDKASTSSQLARSVFEAAARRGLHLALANLPKTLFEATLGNFEWDEPSVTCLRSCLMKPEHKDWIDQICQVLSLSADEALAGRADPLTPKK